MKFPARTVQIEDFKVEYEKFFLVSLDMLCISSYDGHFKKVNPSFEEVLGFSSEELCAKSYLDFIHPDDIERTIKEVEKQLLTKQQVLNFENRYRCKNGTYKWLSWKSAPVGNFMYAAARDITEEKRIKDELEMANRDLESFNYSVAHDLRAPIRSLVGFSTSILEDPESNLSQDAAKNLNRIQNSANKMGILVNALLSLSSLGRKNVIKKSVNLSDLAKEVADELQSSNPGRKVRFVIAKEIVVEGDVVLLRMVIANLLGNAWKYSSKSNHDITIEFGQTSEKGARTFFVRDNGAGFNMQYQDKLFGTFQRLHSQEEFEGNGIGLATTQKIIQRHGGRIWATGSVGKGATFYFTI